MPIISQAYNLSAGNRWILSIPIKAIDDSYSIDNLILNLTSLSIPDREIQSSDFSVRGRPVPISTGVREDSREISCNYMLSSDWHQYKFLNTWFELNSNENHGTQQKLTDIALYILSEFKQPIFYINFKGCWLNRLGGFSLNYQDGYNQIEGSFTFKYAYMQFDNMPEL